MCFPKRTYVILFAVSLLNLLIYDLEASSYWLLVVCAAVDTGTVALIWRWGDVHKLYQSSLLFLSVILNFLCELDMSGSNIVFSDYTALARGLTALQLLGACYGLGISKAHWPSAQHRP